MCWNDMLFIEHFCCRGLRRPRGLKFMGDWGRPLGWTVEVCEGLVDWNHYGFWYDERRNRRGLRRPRGLKYLEGKRMKKRYGRGLRRPRGLKFCCTLVYSRLALVEVCEGLVDWNRWVSNIQAPRLVEVCEGLVDWNIYRIASSTSK